MKGAFLGLPDGVESGECYYWCCHVLRAASQNELVQVALNDHVLNRRHGDFEEVRVSRVGEVSIDLLLGVSVERSELVHEVFADLLPIRLVAGVVDKSVLVDRAKGKLFLEEIHLVEEED